MSGMKTIAAPLALSLLLAACAADDSGSSQQTGTFSNCFQKRIQEQLTWCLAEDDGEDFYRASGRHQIIYGRYNAKPAMVKEGVSYCLFEQEDRSQVNACSPEEVMALATKLLPPDQAGSCEATTDPSKSLSGC